MTKFELDLNKILPSYIDRKSNSTVEGEIYEQLRLSPFPAVISGGQTGVDCIGLECASNLGLPAFAILPQNGKQEGGLFKDYLKSKKINVRPIELNSPSYRFRTYANVYFADFTVIYDFVNSEGTKATVDACEYFNRPYIVISECSSNTLDKAKEYLLKYTPEIINIAGNSKSKLNEMQVNNIYQHLITLLRAYCFLRKNRTIEILKNMENKKTIIAIPNFDVSKHIFCDFFKKEYGYEINFSRKLVYEIGMCTLVLARPREIIPIVKSRGAMAGFVGYDLCREFDYKNIILDTGLIPNAMVFCQTNKKSNEKDNMCSQYPQIAKEIFPQKNITAITGSAESYLSLGVYSCALDSYQTGITAFENNIQVNKKIFQSSLTMIGSDSIKKTTFFNHLLHYLIG